jgi:hypothetical protein
VNYTDCWEISVYRFLHLVFSKNGKIDFGLLKQYTDPQSYQSNLLEKFFQIYPIVHADADYYATAEGLQERAEWAQMLNASKCLYLKRKQMGVVQVDEGGLYEVAATIENTFAFFKHFFPRLAFWKADKDAERYKLLLDELSRPDLKLGLFDFTECVLPEYKYNAAVISVNLVPMFEWELYSFLEPIYDEHGNVVRQNRIGGHSDYRYASAKLRNPFCQEG